MSHKKIHRFLVEHIANTAIGQEVSIADERAVHQLHRVLKIHPGESVQCFTDNGPQYTIEISSIEKKEFSGTVTIIQQPPALSRTVIAAISIVKGDAFELIVQKLTELGVDTIVPLISSRTVKQAVRLDRLQSISNEALEQCGGFRRVHITKPLTLEQCFAQYQFESIVLDPITDQTDAQLAEKMVWYVGPEGGWDENDEAIIKSHKPQHLKISDRVLRTETAAIVGAYKLLWE